MDKDPKTNFVDDIPGYVRPDFIQSKSEVDKPLPRTTWGRFVDHVDYWDKKSGRCGSGRRYY